MSCESASSLFGASPINGISYQSTGNAANSYQSASRDMILPSVFVQIPSQHLVAPKQNGQASVARHDEIKAEPPIKSEIDNQQQASVALRANKNSALSVNISQATTNLTANLVTARPKVKCFKCEKCPFMSISQDGYNKHMEDVHSNDQNCSSPTNRTFRNKILCPGCENVFYSKMSLKIHLVNDHQMSRPDISQLLESLFVKKGASSVGQKQKSTPTEGKAVVEKQKIYLKNVEVLQNPRFTNRQFDPPDPPAAILSPVECQSEFSSSLTDDITSTDNSIASELSFNRIQVHNTFNQLDNNCLYPQISNIEPTFETLETMVASSSRSNRISLDGNRDCISLETTSPVTETSIDDTNRPESGSSLKYSEHIANWSTIASTTQSSQFQYQYQPQISTTPLPTIKISTNSCQTPAVSPLPSISLCQNEKKKIYIKNIDILKEPLIKPSKSINLPDSNYRKNTLHLRTVDEVNLLINKVQHESNYNNSSDNVTLSENDYRCVLNEMDSDYGNIIPQYLENDVNDFMSNFSNEPILPVNPSEYLTSYSGNNNNNYALTNLDVSAQSYSGSNSIIVLDSVIDENICDERQLCNSILNTMACGTNGQSLMNAYDSMRVSESFQINHTNNNISATVNSDFCLDDSNHLFSNKFMPSKMLENSDYMIVSSEEIIDTADDILDLTNDEVEQILDDSLISPQDFDTFNSSRQSLPSYSRFPRINVVANLTKQPEQVTVEDLEKGIDARPLETPVKNLEESTDCEITEINETSVSTLMAANKKKSGRTKGARQINGVSNRSNITTTKCSVENCGMRFATEAAILLHEQCHSANKNDIRCPKCEVDPAQINGDESNQPLKVPRNWNWNTLHTHLWREHNIDMELYSCPECSFKTPILSRLKNTHMKIHSENRDFKCDYCPKAFKNARQMKNHRRIHTRATPPTISQCKYCGQSFYSAKHLKEHYYTHSEAVEHQRQPSALQCDICSETFTSKHALRTHHLNHFHGKRFNCDECEYKSNDHNAFRRHQMVHNKEVKYKCPCCSFQCIQSTNYKNHILKKHPESAKQLMFMCDKCNFVTVNKRMYDMHCLNHNNSRIPSVQLD